MGYKDFTTDNYTAANQQANAKDQSGGKSKSDGNSSKMTRIEDAKNLRDTKNTDDLWSEMISVYANEYPYSELDDYDDSIAPNLIFSTVNVFVPSVAIQNPKIDVNPNRMEDIPTAELAEAVVNDQWSKFDVQDQIRKAVKDFIIVGHGWVKCVWETKEEEVELTQAEFVTLVEAALGQKAEAVAQDPGSEELFGTDEEIIENLPTKVDRLVVDRPLVRRRSPFDIYVDPDATTLEDIRWIAERSFIPIEVARKNKDYSSTQRKNIPSVSKSEARDDVEVDSDTTDSDDATFAEIYEFYDIVEGTVCTFADGMSGYLIKPDKSPFPKGHPYVFMPNYEVPERFYPIGDVETIFPLQLELAITRTALLNDRKRGRRITLFREAALGSQGVEDLRAGKDNVMIPVLKDVPFSDVFQQVQSAGLTADWYRADQQTMSDIDIVSGVSEYARGGQTEIARTATEVGVMADAANARSADKLSRVEKAMAEVAERMILLDQEFLEMESVVKTVGQDRAEGWQEYTRDDLQGEFSFEIEAGSSAPNNESMQRQQAAQMMQSFGGLIGSGLLNDQELIGHVMKLEGIKDPERFLGQGMPAPVPEEVPPDQVPPGQTPGAPMSGTPGAMPGSAPG